MAPARGLEAVSFLVQMPFGRFFLAGFHVIPLPKLPPAQSLATPILVDVT